MRETLHLFACLFIRGGGRTKTIVQEMPRFVEPALDSVAACAVESGLVLTPSRLPAAASRVAALIGWSNLMFVYSNRRWLLRHMWDPHLFEDVHHLGSIRFSQVDSVSEGYPLSTDMPPSPCIEQYKYGVVIGQPLSLGLGWLSGLPSRLEGHDRPKVGRGTMW